MASISSRQTEQRFVIRGVSWEAYEKLLEAFPEHRLRHSYDGWNLEMMSPSPKHEWTKKTVGRFIEALCLDLDIPLKSFGSTTLRVQQVKKGLEPDETYFIAHEPRMRGRVDYDPNVDPPPDLAVEVEESRSLVSRMSIYAALRIPEVWRIRRSKVAFFARTETGRYEPAERSSAFPFLCAADVNRFLDQRQTMDENKLVRSFVAWACERARQPQSRVPRVEP